jgi:fatty acid desaturase
MTAAFLPDAADSAALASDAGPTAAPKGEWRSALSREEIQALLRPSDWRSWISVAVDWGLVFAAMALVAAWPHVWTLPLVVVLALFVIGARQLGLAILMHEASHRSLFASKRVNDFVGSWLCAYPIWSDLHAYRPYHLQHHAKTATAEDPDLSLVTPFPITPASLRRKFLRDLTGRTGVKFARAARARSVARARTSASARRALVGVVVTNAALLAGLAALGHAELYLLWAGAWLTTNTFVTRVRAIAEHALAPDPEDPLNNTRTTLASPLERLFLAPNRVNYHLEHHLLMTVPHYNLPRLHQILRERGALDGACVERGYWRVLRRAASKGTPHEPRLVPSPTGGAPYMVGSTA